MASPTIDSNTRVNIGILGTILSCGIGGAVYLTTLNANVIEVSERMVDVKKAIDRNTEQLAVEGRALAVLETLVQTMNHRLTVLENRVDK